MKTGAHSQARIFSGWKADGHGTETVGCGSEAIGIAGRDPRQSGCRATGIAAMKVTYGSKAVGRIVILTRVMHRHLLLHRQRK